MRGFFLGAMLAAAFLALRAVAAPGIPNELASLFKSTGKLPDRIVTFQGHTLKGRVEPRHEAIVLLYDVPEALDRSALLREVVLDARGFGPEFTLQREGVGEHYVLTWNARIVEGAWVTVQPSDEGLVALAIKLPPRAKISGVARGHDALAYLGDGLVWVKRTATPLGVLNEAAGLDAFSTVTLVPEAAPTGKLWEIFLQRGRFADQLKVDQQGRVWFTQPFDNLFSHYDPSSQLFAHVEVGTSPDGLGIDRLGRLWFGEYGAERLAMYDPKTGTYERYAPDYEYSHPAIPYEDQEGNIWVSDHEQNRIGRFDPATKEFTSVEVASKGAWAVDLVETADHRFVWVTECYANRIGRIEKTTRTYSELMLPTASCPAFFTPVGHDLYISLWQTGSFLKLDTLTGEVVEFKVTGDSGFGPIARLGDGAIAIGSLGSGRVYKFDPRTQKLVYVAGVGRLKDGLTVAPDGVTVWIADIMKSVYKVSF